MSAYELGKHRGKYVVVYHDEQGIRRRRSLGTSDEIVARTRLAESEHLRRQRSLSRGYTVGDLFKLYITDKIHDKKHPTTIVSIKRAATNTHSVFGHLRPEHITKDMVRLYASERMGRVSRGTVVQELSYLRSCLKWAKNSQLIPEAPHIAVPSPPPPRDHYLTKDDFKRVLSVCTTPHLRLFIIVAVTTAARCTAILELTWDRVFLTEGLIQFHNPSKHKTSKGRAVVPINTTLLNALTEASRHSTCNYVIEYHSHGIKDIRHSLQVVSRKAGIKFTPHVLRHTAAVWMAEAGVPMSEIAQYLGHRSTTVTERVYARYSPQYLRKAASALELS